jgi:hypothetical protein
MSETTCAPRLGGRYLRDPDTGERVREDERSRIKSGTAKSKLPRKKSPAPKAPQARPRAGADAPPASEGSTSCEPPVRRKDK